jgi:RimJ/RimL family protein N-acetyltransferase
LLRADKRRIKLLIHEDPFFEEAAMSGDFDVIVPVSIFVPANGDEQIITAYNAVWDICEEYEKKNSDDILNAKSLGELCRDIVPIVREMDYDVDLKGSRVILEYRIDSVNEAVEMYSRRSTIVRFAEEIEDLEWPLLHVPDSDDEDPCSIVSENGVVCAFAGINDFSDDDSVEINVETALEHRGKGCGTAATAGLVKFLIEDGNTVAYNCAESNKASSAIARKLGMTLKGKRFSVVCYAGVITEQ